MPFFLQGHSGIWEQSVLFLILMNLPLTLCSYHIFLAGKISLNQCFPFGEDFYERFGVECHFGSAMVELDCTNRKVYLKNDNSLSYDRCLFATGASPILPNVQGLKRSDQIITLRTARDVHRFQKALSSVKNAVILGASLVGVELAHQHIPKWDLF